MRLGGFGGAGHDGAAFLAYVHPPFGEVSVEEGIARVGLAEVRDEVGNAIRAERTQDGREGLVQVRELALKARVYLAFATTCVAAAC